MIKRLKWNVLHGGGGGEESDSGLSSSDDSDAGDAEAARKLLERLVSNDADLRARLRPDSQSSDDEAFSAVQSGDGVKLKRRRSRNKTEALLVDVENGQTPRNNSKRGRLGNDNTLGSQSAESCEFEDSVSSEESEKSFGSCAHSDHCDEASRLSSPKEMEGDGVSKSKTKISWRECDICPGKRFLHDREVEDHLNSKGHARALRHLHRAKAADIENDSSEDTPKKHEDHRICIESIKNVSKTDDSNSEALSLPKSFIGKSCDEADVKKVMSHISGKKRKAAVKKKLKWLKQRKWERMQAISDDDKRSSAIRKQSEDRNEVQKISNPAATTSPVVPNENNDKAEYAKGTQKRTGKGKQEIATEGRSQESTLPLTCIADDRTFKKHSQPFQASTKFDNVKEASKRETGNKTQKGNSKKSRMS